VTVNVALLVRVTAKPGKEREVADFLRNARSAVEAEPGTNPWFAVRFDESTFGIFDAFPDDDARQTHLAGAVGQALKDQGPDLFSGEPTIEPLTVLAEKLPG
jgi:quinol monooxygenase YgiN